MRRDEKEYLINSIIDEHKDSKIAHAVIAILTIAAIIIISLLIKAGYEFLSK